MRIPRTRQRSFLPRWIGRLERRSPEVAQLIRQAFLRGISTRQVGRVERDLPELLHFFVFPQHLWRKLRTTNVIERRFVEVRRRTRPMVVFTNVESVDRIVYAIFSRFNEDWKNHTLELFTQAA